MKAYQIPKPLSWNVPNPLATWPLNIHIEKLRGRIKETPNQWPNSQEIFLLITVMTLIVLYILDLMLLSLFPILDFILVSFPAY